MMVE
jgi:MFS family permease